MPTPPDPIRSALVTGAGSGLGRAIALRLLRDGYRVLITDVNIESGHDTLAAAQSEGHGDRARFQRLDVNEESDVERGVVAATAQFGGLSVMVNNAGITGVFGPLTHISSDDWDFTYSVLMRGVFLGTKHAARYFQTQKIPGVIINIASAAGYTAGLAPHAYSSAKAAVLQFTRSAAHELAEHRIRVVAVSPGLILTPLANRPIDEFAEMLDTAQPWPEHGTAEQVAGVVAFAAGPDAQFITGESIVVDGGLLTHGPGATLLTDIGLEPRRPASGISYGTTGVATIVRGQPLIAKREDSTAMRSQ